MLVLDVDEAEADKLLVSLDPLAALAEADAGQLAELLASIETRSEELRMLFADLASAAEVEAALGLVDPEEIPGTPSEARSRARDLYVMGRHRLVCGAGVASRDRPALRRLL